VDLLTEEEIALSLSRVRAEAERQRQRGSLLLAAADVQGRRIWIPETAN
jgi:hypothetical protein